jgi:hypothetical protein
MKGLAMNNAKFVSTITNFLLLCAFVFYLLLIGHVITTSLNHDNFSTVLNNEGNPIQDDEGNVKWEPSPPPEISKTVTTALTLIGTYLAINFGQVLGISIVSAQQVQLTRTADSYMLSSTVATPLTRNDQIKNVIDFIVDLLKAFYLIVKKGVQSFSNREWAVIIYLLGLVIATIGFAADGGLSGNPGTVAAPLEQLTLTLFGAVAGALRGLTPSAS